MKISFSIFLILACSVCIINTSMGAVAEKVASKPSHLQASYSTHKVPQTKQKAPVAAAVTKQVNLGEELLKGGINAIPVLLAAFLGPLFAFKMQNRHEDMKEKNEEFKAGLRAQLVLYEHFTALFSLKRNMLQKFETDEERWLNLLPILAFLPKSEIDMSQLYFINQQGGNQLHVDLVVAQGNYFLTVKTLQARNAKHNHYQTLISKRGRDNVSDSNLKNATDSMYESVYDTIPIIVKAVNELGEFLKKHYDGNGIISVPEESEITGSPLEKRKSR